MDVKVDEELTRQIVQKAIFESLDAQSREVLIQNAVNYLITPPPKEPGYYNKQQPSALQETFDRQLRLVANEIVLSYLNDEKVKAAIREQILAVLDKMIQDKGTWLYDQIGYAVGEKIMRVLKEERD